MEFFQYFTEDFYVVCLSECALKEINNHISVDQRKRLMQNV